MEKDFIDTIETHRGIIYKVCKMYCPLDEDCDDLYQDIVAQLWRAWGGFRGEAKISTWIYRVALNTAISGFRKQKRNPLNQSVSTDDLSLSHIDNRAQKEDIELLHMAIGRLTEVEKAMVMLYLDEVSYEEIAAIMGITQNNVRVKMLRIREKLKKIMELY
ncbi:MAG: sigma-70 family RNA polymerase sigma factor [Bacteroidetes bacterium]|nr:MAG: sigma-70 family RNA polymerase sigma factor [Bacteroidota bacterium]